MRTLLFILIFTSSSSGVFGTELSDFERGYSEGVKSCEVAESAWVCTISWENNNIYKKIIVRESAGRSRAEALLKITPQELAKANNANLNGHIDCKEL